jgi:flagellar protein FlaG
MSNNYNLEKELVMDGIANVARQQQSQMSASEMASTPETQGNAVAQAPQVRQEPKNLVEQAQQDAVSTDTKIDSKEEVQDLVNKLNKAMAPLNTNLKFGVDAEDIFYVSVIDVNTDKMIRRFPAEKAQEFLPKMQEVSGILFDSKG